VGDKVFIKKTGEIGILRHILVVKRKTSNMISIDNVYNLASAYDRSEIESFSEQRDRKINEILN